MTFIVVGVLLLNKKKFQAKNNRKNETQKHKKLSFVSFFLKSYLYRMEFAFESDRFDFFCLSILSRIRHHSTLRQKKNNSWITQEAVP